MSNEALRRRFPKWLKKRLPAGGATEKVRRALDSLKLHTVCESAHCPNQCECFARGTATFMILGDVCTRSCRFCAVSGGVPSPLDAGEPDRVAGAADELGLRHAVITSVTRDDLPDGGAEVFAETIRAVHKRTDATVEVLTPDFEGRLEDVDTVLTARPEVYNHNVETVPRLYRDARPEADFDRSLRVIEYIAASGRSRAKSGLMVGLGETPDEVTHVIRRLQDAGCSMLTIGQYLSPSPKHLPVAEFVTPERFDEYRAIALDVGIRDVASGPFVRSSYRAGIMLSGDTTAGLSEEKNH